MGTVPFSAKAFPNTLWIQVVCLTGVCGVCKAQTARVPMYRPVAPSSVATRLLTEPASPSGEFCWLFPTRYGCMNYGAGAAANINTFFGTAGETSFFNQIKSIYNGASGSATISADVASLNFANGMQVTTGVNMQAGAPLPAQGMAQAAQNMLYGGTEFASILYPLMAVGADKLGSAGGFGMTLDMIVKEGIDLQNFSLGNNLNVNSPPSHSSGQVEGYLQYNSTNVATASDSIDFAGAIFVGGSYGYSYTSHDYAQEYGFGDRVRNCIGQISAGILINGVARITVSRAFGPWQSYIDSVTMTQTRVNNFKAWSIGITYQAPASAPK
jgi:hypothetical protein